MVEIAVGLIMATYFGAIAKSLVNDVIMPPIGLLLGGVDFSTMKVVLQEASADGATAEVAINYGIFFNTVLTFVIVAFAVFMIVKSYNRMKERWEKKEEAAPAAPPKPTKEEVLLTEIRDLLKK